MTIVPRGSRETIRSARLGRQRLMGATVARYTASHAMRTTITSASTVSPKTSEPQRCSGDKRSMMGRACNPISTNANTLTTNTAVSHTA